MTRAATAKSDALPEGGPVRAALEDEAVRQRLSRHARAVVGTWAERLPPGERQALAEDALQETYRRALQRGGEFDHGRGAVGAWLHGILVNVLRESRRDRRPVRPIEPEDWDTLAAACADPDAWEAAELLSRLPEDQQAVLRMRIEGGLSFKDIGERLGISEGNARVRHSRALRALKEAAGAAPEEDRL